MALPARRFLAAVAFNCAPSWHDSVDPWLALASIGAITFREAASRTGASELPALAQTQFHVSPQRANFTSSTFNSLAALLSAVF